MANERLYLRCRACGDTLYLGKSFLGGFYYGAADRGHLESELSDFYEKHTYCCYDPDNCRLEDGKIALDGCYEAVYETGDWDAPCNERRLRMAELKPCPFCGGAAFVGEYRYGDCGETFFVFCTDCQAESHEHYTEEEAVEAWNRRAADG